MVDNKEEFIKKWNAEDGDELRKYRVREFIGIIEDGTETREFNTNLYFRMIEKMTVFEDKKIIVKYLDGTKIDYII